MGVFQVEGAGMRRCLMDLRPTEFDHITATISLYRPGPMDFIPDFIACLHGEKQPEYVHPILEPILARDDGGLRLPGAGDSDSGRRRRLHPRRGRSGPPRHQQEIQEDAGRAPRDLCQGFGGKIRPEARRGRRHLGRADGVCPLRLQPGARRRLRGDRRPDRVPQGLLPGRVHGRAVDDRAARHGEDRPADRRVPAHGHRGAAAQHQRQQQQLHGRAVAPGPRGAAPGDGLRFPRGSRRGDPHGAGCDQERRRGAGGGGVAGSRRHALQVARRFHRPLRLAQGQPPRAGVPGQGGRAG